MSGERLVLRGETPAGERYTIPLRADGELFESSQLFRVQPVLASDLGDVVCKVVHAGAGPEAEDRIRREATFFEHMQQRRDLPVPYVASGKDDRLHIITRFDPEAMTAAAHFKDPDRATRFSARVDGVTFAASLVRCVGRLHDLGIVHCDLKPGNVLFRRSGSGYEFTLIDLAHAHSLPGGPDLPLITRVGQTPGTPGWTSPDKLEGRSPHAGWDMWGVALLLVAFALDDGDPLRSSSNARQIRTSSQFQIERLRSTAGLDTLYVETCRRLLVAEEPLTPAHVLGVLEGGTPWPPRLSRVDDELEEEQTAMWERLADGYRDFETLRIPLRIPPSTIVDEAGEPDAAGSEWWERLTPAQVAGLVAVGFVLLVLVTYAARAALGSGS